MSDEKTKKRDKIIVSTCAVCVVASLIYACIATHTALPDDIVQIDANPPSSPAPPPEPAVDDFGVPLSFKATYKLIKDENINLNPTATRRNVRIAVPNGLSPAIVEAETRAAAEATYTKDGQPHAITVFAYKPNTDTNTEYTAGRLIWAPGGDWANAGEDVPVSEHQGTFDLSDLYSDAPTGESAQIANVEEDQDAAGKAEEAPLLRHFSERHLKQMDYAIEDSLNNQIENPIIPGDYNASVQASKAEMCKRFHITSAQYETIRDIGDEQDWPEPP